MKPAEPDFVVSTQAAFVFGDFRLDTDGTLWHEDTNVHLPPKELAVLRLLLEHAGQIVSLDRLRTELWGDVHVTPDSVPRCISSLRARLGSEDCIHTLYKHGYRINWPVERACGSPVPALPRLAIVPFACATGVPEHLGHAVAEETTARLTAMHPPVFSVLARDSVFTLAGRGMSALQVGEALKADLVMTGRVQALPVHFRLRAEMVRVADGTQIWVEDVLAAREHVASLEKELLERLLFRTVGRASPRGEENAPDGDAYNVFVRGRFEWQTLEPHRMLDAIRHLRRAAELDPKLVQAGEELARATVAQELFGYITPRIAAEQLRRVADGIPEASPDRAAILPALAWMAFHVDRDLEAALRHFTASAHLPPDTWRWRLRALFAAGRHRFDEAGDLLLEALELDPYSPWVNAALAWVYHLGGRPEESLVQVERCLEVCPEHPAARLYGGMILAFNGNPGRALELTSELTRHSPHLDMAMAVHAYALARNGERQKAEEWLERLAWLSRERYVIRSFSAAAYLQLGDRDRAVAELRAADKDRCPWFFQLLADPRLAPLRQHPEFQAMRAQLDAMEAAAATRLEPQLAE
jgi:DNA-binding winged helix-turn-helix (wHTH) protein/tetratricopeptide (TPR) repeat protein